MRRHIAVLSVAMALVLAGTGWAEESGSEVVPLYPQPDTALKQTSMGWEITLKHPGNKEAKALTKKEYTAPCTITLVAKTDSNEIRLFFARGNVFLGWAHDPSNLRYHGPRYGKSDPVAGKGTIPANKFVTVKWEIGDKEATLSVDGDVRASFTGDFSGVSGTVGVGTYGSAVVTVRSLLITTYTAPSGGKKPEPAAAPHDDSSPNFEPIDVTVSTTPPAAPKDGEASDDPADLNAVERPAYWHKAKTLVKSLSEVKGMEVVVSADGDEHGSAVDIIGTVSADSRASGAAGAGIAAGVGLEMRTCFKEAVKALQLRYPYWQPGHIDVSFEDKYNPHDGGSAGTAFSVLMLSMLEGFEIDPTFAVTGDLTVDWKVRTVGGITAKLSGAALDGCKEAAIPEGNEPAFADMRLMYGDASLWNLQVFSIGTLQQAVGLLRMDRNAAIAESIRLFDGLRPALEKSEHEALKNADTIKTLNKILELTPNCLSAKYLLQVADGTAAKRISSFATIYEVVRIVYPYRRLIDNRLPIDRSNLSMVTMENARKQIEALRPIADVELLPLINDAMAYMEAVNSVAYNGGEVSTINVKARIVNSRLETISSEKGFVDKLLRDGY